MNFWFLTPRLMFHFTLKCSSSTPQNWWTQWTPLLGFLVHFLQPVPNIAEGHIVVPEDVDKESHLCYKKNGDYLLMMFPKKSNSGRLRHQLPFHRQLDLPQTIAGCNPRVAKHLHSFHLSIWLNHHNSLTWKIRSFGMITITICHELYHVRLYYYY